MNKSLICVLHPEYPKFIPPVDIFETKDNFVITIDVPGFKKDELELYISGSLFIIKGSKKEIECKDVKIHRRERFTYFERIFLFGSTLNADVHEKLEDGVLTLLVDKTNQTQFVMSKL